MRTQRVGRYLRCARWWLVLAAVLAGCGNNQDAVQVPQAEQDQDDTTRTADPLPDVSVADANDEQLLAACRNLNLAQSTFAADTTLPNESRVRITPAAGNHNIASEDLVDGRMTARIDVKSGPGIPSFGMKGADTACVLIVGPNDDALETIFVSYRTGARLARVPTSVIHKARGHPHADADWIAIGRASLLTGAGEKPGGMIPWLFQNDRIWAAQSGCGRHKCCLQAMPF